MARFNIGGFTKYNAERASRGRASVRPSTFGELEKVGLSADKFERWIATSGVVRAAMYAKAADVKDYWKEIAPHWGDKDPKKDSPDPFPRDAYQDSIEIHEEKGEIRVGSDLPGLAKWLEYGSIHNPEHGYGARVLANFGGSGNLDKAEGTNIFVG